MCIYIYIYRPVYKQLLDITISPLRGAFSYTSMNAICRWVDADWVITFTDAEEL